MKGRWKKWERKNLEVAGEPRRDLERGQASEKEDSEITGGEIE